MHESSAGVSSTTSGACLLLQVALLCYMYPLPYDASAAHSKMNSAFPTFVVDWQTHLQSLRCTVLKWHYVLTLTVTIKSYQED